LKKEQKLVIARSLRHHTRTPHAQQWLRHFRNGSFVSTFCKNTLFECALNLRLFFLSLEQVCVLTCDGRFLVGQLMGHDQLQNLILNEAVEHVYSPDDNVEEVPLGLYVVRGDNVAVIAEFDKLDLTIKTEPLPEIHQQIF
jgi:U6 snRNA-associated Sm-like protein LSm8